MTTYSLWPGRPAVTTLTSSVPFICGIGFETTSGILWLEGYWWYAGGQTAAGQKFCLWCVTGGTTFGGGVSGTLVPGSTTVNTAPFTANSWNYVPLATPIPLAVGNPYVAATGYVISGAFANQAFQFNSTGAYPNGLTSGPLFAFSDDSAGGAPGTVNPWGGWGQGLFATGQGSDPTAFMPISASNSASYGIDISVSDTPPPGYQGPWSLYPNTSAARAPATADSPVPYGTATEVICNAASRCTAIRYRSPATATVLADWCGVWDVATQTCIAQATSPSWSGPAASGWVQASLPVAATLVPGRRYKLHVAVYSNNVATTKDASDPWGPAGALRNGITAGPVTAPPLSNASDAWNYNNNPGGTPPYSDGTHLAHGQSTFSQTAAGYSGTPPYPLLWANAGTGSGTQDYFIDGVFELEASGAVMAAGIP